jgi:uncharacterized protein involved in tellurium resistance
MPCTYYETPEEIAERQNEYLKELNEVTRMLCCVMRLADPAITGKVEGLDKWWTKHQEMDRRREISEKKALIKQLQADIARLSKDC